MNIGELKTVRVSRHKVPADTSAASAGTVQWHS